MATVNREIALEIIKNNGYFADDPQVTKVVSYYNQWGGISYAIIYGHEDQMKYHNSPACQHVQTIWEVTD